MSDNTLAMNATDATETTENQAPAEKSFSQKEVDAMMARMRAKYEKTFSDLGDIDELRKLKQQADSQRQEDALKRGEFEKILRETAEKKDAIIQQKDRELKEFKVNLPIIEAASKYKAVAPEQVKTLLNNYVRLSDQGEVEVVDKTGAIRYSDSGQPYKVDDLVKEFLTQNPHFVSSAPSTTHTKSNVNPVNSLDFDLNKLDMSNPADRQKYKQAKEQGLLKRHN